MADETSRDGHFAGRQTYLHRTTRQIRSSKTLRSVSLQAKLILYRALEGCSIGFHTTDSTTPERQLQKLVVEYEKFQRERLPVCTRETGDLVETSCTIMDLKNVGISQFWKVRDRRYHIVTEVEILISDTVFRYRPMCNKQAI